MLAPLVTPAPDTLSLCPQAVVLQPAFAPTTTKTTSPPSIATSLMSRCCFSCQPGNKRRQPLCAAVVSCCALHVVGGSVWYLIYSRDRTGACCSAHQHNELCHAYSTTCSTDVVQNKNHTKTGAATTLPGNNTLTQLLTSCYRCDQGTATATAAAAARPCIQQSVCKRQPQILE